MFSLPTVIQAQFTYTTNNGGITITGYTGSDKAVNIPGTLSGLSVTSIENGAFYNRRDLTNVIIPNSVTSIQDNTFFFCTGLTEITVNELNSVYSSMDGVLFNKNQTLLIQYPLGKAGSYTIPNSVTDIGFLAFSTCPGLTNITIPNSVVSIGEYAFSGCANLTSITIPNSVTNIGTQAFARCTELIEVTIPNSVISLADGAFASCAKLTSVTMPINITSIADGLFTSCTRLSSVTIPNSVTNIGSQAFAYCTSLASIRIPPNVTSIGHSTFNFCTNLTSIVIPDLVTIIGDNEFSSCFNLTNITIPNGLTDIGYYSFAGCSSLSSIMIPAGITNISLGAFVACSSLSAIEVDTLNPYYCSADGVLFNKSQTTLMQYPGGKAGEYTIPGTVTKIGNDAFGNSPLLVRVIVPMSVNSIGDRAFNSCPGLGAIEVDASNPFYSSVDGVLFDKSLTTLLQYPGAKPGHYAIPDSVIRITSGAFHTCPQLTRVTIPSSLTHIAVGEFGYCHNLSAIDVDASNSVYLSGDGILYDKNQTTLVRYPEGKAGNYTTAKNLTQIGEAAFLGSILLTNITIPASVIWIGKSAFAYSASLKGIYFRGNAPAGGGYEFDGDNATVYYLTGTLGWGPTYGGLPTMLWNPQVQTHEASFGVRTNQFGFSITGPSDRPIVVEICTNLAEPAWLTVATNGLSGGAFYFSDAQWANYPARYYRLRAQ